MMYWTAALLVAVPVAILVMLTRDEQRAQRLQAPRAWLRRWWKGSEVDRRHCHRYRTTIPVTYRVLPTHPTAAPAMTRDLGFGGLGIMVHEKLTPGMVLELSLHSEPPMRPLAIQGAVKWIREMSPGKDARRTFWAGIQITHAGMATADQLQALLQQISPDGTQHRV